MNPENFKKRTKTFALKIIELVENLPRTRNANVLAQQLLRCGTSIGANYRAACRAKSLADFIAKMKIVEEEADETIYWLELLVESKFITQKAVEFLEIEADEIIAIVVSSIKTARENLNDRNRQSSFVNRQSVGGVTQVAKGDSL